MHAQLGELMLSPPHGWLDSIPLALFSSFGYTEMMVMGIIALLLFGSRLPEVARNFGATYKQLRGKVDEFQREFRNWDQEMQSDKPVFRNDEEESEKYVPQSPKFVPPADDDDDDDE